MFCFSFLVVHFFVLVVLFFVWWYTLSRSNLVSENFGILLIVVLPCGIRQKQIGRHVDPM